MVFCPDGALGPADGKEMVQRAAVVGNLSCVRSREKKMRVERWPSRELTAGFMAPARILNTLRPKNADFEGPGSRRGLACGWAGSPPGGARGYGKAGFEGTWEWGGDRKS